ncbi:hypothetical protein BofuT4_uP155160.1 [Botrytis cinerea T4]|uniref:Uncharacterized protein n=1 Tax=Botryotinia fuckeliana (strain T4) TaxID=999810 RepID=G2YV77_BOTF4|nr:hypothetical protein BofuT4_uP155160.1 [Botrytis cinerea T4]
MSLEYTTVTYFQLKVRKNERERLWRMSRLKLMLKI